MTWIPRPGFRDEPEYGTSSQLCPTCGARFMVRREGYWDTAIPKPDGPMEPRRHRFTRRYCSNACKQKAYRARK